jgi:hypothetical protein
MTHEQRTTKKYSVAFSAWLFYCLLQSEVKKQR